jgi:putative hemolysin
MFMISNTNRNLAALVAVCFVGLFMLGCAQQGQQNLTQNVTTNVSTNATLANPASVYCIQNGGASQIITAADGSQGGLCVFPNGSQCEEWAYYRGECSPTNQTVAQNLSANVSNLNESDFLVVDDSMSSLLNNAPSAPEPQEPQ